MGAQKAGLAYEHQMANDIYEHTDGALFPLRVGWSGNGKIPAPDLYLDDGRKGHAFELKRTTQDRISITHDPETGDDDLTQLIEFAKAFPRTCCAYVGVRFTHRQLVLAKLWLGAPDNKAIVQSAVSTCPIDAKITHAGNLSIHKPESEYSDAEWTSARAGDDVQYLLETIGYE